MNEEGIPTRTGRPWYGVMLGRAKFQERLEQWLGLVTLMWPECPAHVGCNGNWLIIRQASAIISRA
jgi:hypothetical protein